nr:DUF3141 domain-containing protein [Pollutimonas subterranea]
MREYAVDAWQRSILYADVMRQRGNQYQAHLTEEVPHVLDFPSEVVMFGRDLPRPVNYWLVRIIPPYDKPTDHMKRPFVVIDPRAGHGPGIGGFKVDSEIGVVIGAGHPCYFIGFLPDPVPGQTIEDVMHAEAAFLEKVIALHPCREGKPAVIGNCQAGWQILMTAAMRPELFGPIIVAGAPLSYWAGWRGRNPMRYAAGLLGGSWLTAMTSDLGAGRFDGAWLVQNFENLNPANTLWSKQHHVYTNIDDEAPRYLGFEKYWGGYVYLNDVEMQYIVDNLFVGNRLATTELLTSDGVRIDLRNIRSPIVVFCSYGDNITPPPQALGWITDLYDDDKDVLTHDQTIIYATHESVGHLGIFVSGAVSRKEHHKFATNIDLIDVLPAGIYRATIAENPQKDAVLSTESYELSVQREGIASVREIVQPDPESDRRFAAVAQVSKINLGLYRQFVQPWVRQAVTPQTAYWVQTVHPLRLSYEWWSDRNPLAPVIANTAKKVREQRTPIAGDNPFLQIQGAWSDAIVKTLNLWQDVRDDAYEKVFEWTYSSPWVQALTGEAADDESSRRRPSVSPEHRAFVAQEIAGLRNAAAEGGAVEAGIRAVFYIHRFCSSIDERRANLTLELHQPDCNLGFNMDSFRDIVRRQANIIRIDADAAIAALPQLLAREEPARIREVARTLERLRSLGPLSTIEESSLTHMLDVFNVAATSQEAVLS